MKERLRKLMEQSSQSEQAAVLTELRDRKKEEST